MIFFQSEIVPRVLHLNFCTASITVYIFNMHLQLPFPCGRMLCVRISEIREGDL